jgi:hypothetical protein
MFTPPAMKTNIFTLVVLLLASTTIATPVASQADLSQPQQEDIEDSNIADLLIKEEGLPEYILQQLDTNQDYDSANSLQKRGDDQQVQEESAKEEAALDLLQDIQQNDKELHKRCPYGNPGKPWTTHP